MKKNHFLILNVLGSFHCYSLLHLDLRILVSLLSVVAPILVLTVVGCPCPSLPLFWFRWLTRRIWFCHRSLFISRPNRFSRAKDLRFAGSLNPQRICPRIRFLVQFSDRF
jgi:hypothetical protein